jgi:transposase
MYKIVHSCFPNAEQIVDRFHVQKLMYDALQDLRIRHRWEALNEENRMKAMYKDRYCRYRWCQCFDAWCVWSSGK